MKYTEIIIGLSVLTGYAALLNIIGFLLMRSDKKRAKKGAWRIQEKTFFIVALFGGALGCMAGMNVFRHKTNHRAFKIGMPVMLIINIIFCALLTVLIFIK